MAPRTTNLRSAFGGLCARAAAVLVVGGGLGVAVNLLRPDGLRPGGFVAAASCPASGGAALAAPTPAAPAVAVQTPDEVQRLCGAPGVVIADVRPPDRYAAGHVADAVHLPCSAWGEVLTKGLARVEGKQTLVVYGDSTAEAMPVAESLRQRLHGPPPPHVVVLDGGFPAWSQAGLACTSGPCPECGERAENRP